MITSIHFKVKKWDYNKKAPLTKTHTDCTLMTHPLRSNNEPDGKAAGLTFIWTLVLTGEGLEILYYSSEEFFVIPNRIISDEKLLEIIKQSYGRTSFEVAQRNIKVGLDAGFPRFEKIPIDLPHIRSVLDM
ncbi:MAG: hypothetical protein JNN00_19340 [Chitinophagaceae bacterium]|nr:hypothetical protein [Chitinophagaceae bacterium]